MTVGTAVTLSGSHTSVSASIVVDFVVFKQNKSGRNDFKISSINSWFSDSIRVCISDSFLLLNIALYCFIHFQCSIEDKSIFYAI